MDRVWTMPVGMLWTEAQLARQRRHEQAALEVTLIHAAIVDAIVGGGHLRSVIEELTDE